MANDIEFPDKSDHGRKTITSGFFEREIRLSGDETAAFLHNLADAIESDTSITVSGSDWEIPFEYREPIEVEVEFSKKREGELEIEVEFAEAHGSEGSGLSVE
ncbi:amphi-Trp domain-containing protein [Halalkalicoccus subterraneus]|uniref:amphi-Trp domain-containing protein n=1 Tax=Halalkalicoccus subterraneus TaxID=2675002 RepID=UPI000EFCFBB7|nr:amphi-Trp domain-containing protein [Halalkalicoccus subterraneus]